MQARDTVSPAECMCHKPRVGILRKTQLSPGRLSLPPGLPRAAGDGARLPDYGRLACTIDCLSLHRGRIHAMTKFEHLRPCSTSGMLKLADVGKIADNLRRGAMAVLPTETGYMLAAMATA